MSNYIVGLNTDIIRLGKTADNEVLSVIFPKYEDFEATLTNVLPKETEGYPVLLTLTEDGWEWNVTATDLAREGIGKCEVVYTQNGKIKHSATTYETHIVKSLSPSGEMPEPMENWYNKLVEVKDETVAANREAQTAADAAAADAALAEEIASDVEGYAQSASESASIADRAMRSAQAAAGYASADAITATNAKNDAVTAKNTALSAKNAAVAARDDAVNAKSDAAFAKIAAQQSATAAKASLDELKDGIAHGDFKGEKGEKGDPGVPGTPGRDGSDYVLTDADRTEIAEKAADDLQPSISDLNEDIASLQTDVGKKADASELTNKVDKVEGKNLMSDSEIARLASVHNYDDSAVRADIDELKKKVLVYGFVEHMDILAPTQRIDYIGANRFFTPITMNMSTHIANYGSWSDFEWLLGNRPAMVRRDGTLDYYLDPSDYTKKEDGSESDVANVDYDGNAFAWIPKIYKQEEIIGSDRYVRFSLEPMEGFEAIGFIDENMNELDGVWIPMFYGWRDASGKMRSIANGDIATHSTNTSAEYTAISTNGERYKFFGGSITETLVDMMLMLAKTTELQGAFGYGNRNGYNSADATTYGKTANLAINCGQFWGSTDGKSTNRAFHSMVLLTQNQYQRDPYMICDRGRWKVSPYCAYDFDSNSFLDSGKYIDTEIDLPNVPSSAWAYPNWREVIPHFGGVPKSEPNLGSTSQGITDGVYRLAAQNSLVCVPRRFGSCSDGALGGLRCLPLNTSASNSGWYIGASLLLLPPI